MLKLVQAGTVEPVLKDHPIGHKNIFCQDRRSLVTGCFILKSRYFCQKCVVCQDRFYCSNFTYGPFVIASLYIYSGTPHEEYAEN